MEEPSSVRTSGHRYRVEQNSYDFGQAPSWTPDNRVLSSQLDSAGVLQIYRSNLDGGHQTCLTCTSVKGPNGLPQSRPQGDWVLFESYGQQPVHTGSPGLGGYGGDLYVMRPNGSHPYRLTTVLDPGNGAEYTASGGVPYDNFHAYWSPNGKEVAWTHTEANSLSAGGQTWSIMVGDFALRNDVPSLTHVQVVGKPYGVYETQPWSPDGSGFLFSAAGGYNSPYQATPPGWGHMQLYFMRVHGNGASLQHPLVTQISDEMPAYQEQAVFTPDMRTVIMMTNRSHTSSDSWANLIVRGGTENEVRCSEHGNVADPRVPLGLRRSRLQFGSLRSRRQDEGHPSAHRFLTWRHTGVLLERRLLQADFRCGGRPSIHDADRPIRRGESGGLDHDAGIGPLRGTSRHGEGRQSGSDSA